MPGMERWQMDIQDGLRKENWSLNGPNRIVKVKRIAERDSTAAGGYITTEQFLFAKTPDRIEKALGLKPGFLQRGCTVFRFLRLPTASEYEYELTALYPDGLAFNPADLEEANIQFEKQPSIRATGVVPGYPPGCRFVHQWRLKDNLALPVTRICDLLPGQTYSYTHR